jgi:hypothetical protein
MELGELSILFAAAAVHSLIHKQKLHEEAPLYEAVRASSGDAGNGRQAPAPAPPKGSERPMTLGRLLGSLDPSSPRFSETERKALTALYRNLSRSPSDHDASTDAQLQGALLARVLEAATGKPAAEAIAAEVLQPSRLLHVAPVQANSKERAGLRELAAPATEAGRFFARSQFDGRPAPTRVKPAAGFMMSRKGSSLALVLRHDDLLLVALVKLAADAPPQVGAELRTCLERAADSLRGLPPASAIRKAPRR